MNTTDLLPRRGDRITVTVTQYHRTCTRRGCPGTASGASPSSGECIYLSRDRGRTACGHPYAAEDWKRRDLTVTGKVSRTFTAAHSGTPFVQIRDDRDPKGPAVARPWLPQYITGWAAAR